MPMAGRSPHTTPLSAVSTKAKSQTHASMLMRVSARERDTNTARRDGGLEGGEHAVSDHDAAEPANAGDQQMLGQDLADEVSASSTERGTNRRLADPRDATGQREVREIHNASSRTTAAAAKSRYRDASKCRPTGRGKGCTTTP